MSKEDGGPAFPRSSSIMPNGGGSWDQEGMTLRQWYAGMALAGRSGNSAIKMTLEDCAEWCFEQADAMLKEENYATENQ